MISKKSWGFSGDEYAYVFFEREDLEGVECVRDVGKLHDDCVWEADIEVLDVGEGDVRER